MIAFAPQSYAPNDKQKQVKRILRKLTGLGVKVIPFQPPVEGMPTTVEYVFKCDYSKDKPSEFQAEEIHAFHDYIKNFVMGVGGLTYNDVSVSLIGRVEGINDSMFPWTSVRFSNVMGFPNSDEGALQTAKKMESNVNAYVAAKVSPPNLSVYQEQLRNLALSSFKDGFSKQLG